MIIKLIAIGKTDQKELEQLTQQYVQRLGHYVRLEWVIIPDIKSVKNLTEDQQKEKEGQLILGKVSSADVLILLDENGKSMSSEEWADFLQKKMNQGIKTLVFVIGGPYGFSSAMYARAHEKISFSKMTFSHQMIRLFFAEQLYRGFTILKNEPYHHR
ncbi:MAG: 23S rRNA (pseudouridine(1915)-N(3))-methyltransferase RlmH [Flavobacterium sp. BFFFF2]|nr:MAG: 23S rRNA (pseudouridine(1915)-N(3))-methyltransferase RlmH [Flavobacterium sp. BFFFF2]